DHVRVVRLVLRGVDGVAADDAVAESGRESLHLPLDGLRHIDGRSVRDVAVAPPRVLAGGRARGVGEALLREEGEGAVGDAAAPDRVFVHGDLLERAAEVHRPGARALRRAPRNRTVERPVDFEHAGAVAEALQPAYIARWKGVAGDGYDLPWGEIEDD